MLKKAAPFDRDLSSFQPRLYDNRLTVPEPRMLGRRADKEERKMRLFGEAPQVPKSSFQPTREYRPLWSNKKASRPDVPTDRMERWARRAKRSMVSPAEMQPVSQARHFNDTDSPAMDYQMMKRYSEEEPSNPMYSDYPIYSDYLINSESSYPTDEEVWDDEEPTTGGAARGASYAVLLGTIIFAAVAGAM